MDLLRHWIARTPGYRREIEIANSEAEAQEYRDDDWLVEGPFVPEANYSPEPEAGADVQMPGCGASRARFCTTNCGGPWRRCATSQTPCPTTRTASDR